MVGGPWALASSEQFERHLDESYGLRNLKPEWMSAQRTSRESSLVRSIRDSEILEICNGSLPWRIQDAHGVQLGTKVLVQIDKVINVGAPDPKAPSPRLLQFAFTDGATSFIGIELDTAKSNFSPNTVPGTKLTLLPTALLRRGRVLFTCEDYAFVGAPQGRARASSNGEAMQSPAGHAGTGQSAGRNMGGATRDSSVNPAASSIINVGGIAAITEESDHGGDVDGIWSENPTVRSRYPAPARQRIPGSSPARRSGTGETNAPVPRRSIERERPPRANDAEASRSNARKVTQAPREGTVIGGYGSNVPEQRAIPVDQEPSPRRIANTVPMDVDIDLTVVQPTQEVTEIPSSPEVMEVSNQKQPEPAPEPERMETDHGCSPRIARLKDLTGSEHHATSGAQICRLYAMKFGKKADHHLLSGPVASTVVDDGTAVRIVAVSNEYLDNLRNSCSPGTGTLSQGTDHSIRRFLRSIYGFVKMEFHDNSLVATACASEPVTSTMVSVYLDDVSARFARYLKS